MFKINPGPTFTTEVSLSVPGKTEPEKITVTFKSKDRAELEEFGKAIKKKPILDSVFEIVEGWSGVDVEFSKENLEKLLANYIPSGNEIITAYHREVYESRVKN
ncbi:hypothetical protein JWJ90_13570 [Desulfobulbus rhabdoformis]|jgi:hypothetical protein|uniref:phage tail assembly chaperone n=1 Tax=Desulfobulbus rhabdoformis TaxID=34032 RepID=UPI001964E8FF|nr:phage tail assembly chaperone [Desulfobulbus rhabdoformis]MBM9615308.1 hypothetical protein [Desulfobulbus rhabdoformis]